MNVHIYNFIVVRRSWHSLYIPSAWDHPVLPRLFWESLAKKHKIFRHLLVIGPQYLFSCFRFISGRKHGRNKKTGQPNASLLVARMRRCHLESHQTHHVHSGLSATYLHIDTRMRVRVTFRVCSPSPSSSLHPYVHPHPHRRIYVNICDAQA